MFDGVLIEKKKQFYVKVTSFIQILMLIKNKLTSDYWDIFRAIGHVCS